MTCFVGSNSPYYCCKVGTCVPDVPGGTVGHCT
jgi:hypothetical protein